jgi:hypothetical protein
MVSGRAGRAGTIFFYNAPIVKEQAEPSRPSPTSRTSTESHKNLTPLLQKHFVTRRSQVIPTEGSRIADVAGARPRRSSGSSRNQAGIKPSLPYARTAGARSLLLPHAGDRVSDLVGDDVSGARGSRLCRLPELGSGKPQKAPRTRIENAPRGGPRGRPRARRRTSGGSVLSYAPQEDRLAAEQSRLQLPQRRS